MKKIISALIVLSLTGCSMIPSFYDDNESLLAVDVRQSVARMTCTDNVREQVITVDKSIERLALYSESKGSDDVGEAIAMMRKTTTGMLEKETISSAYCGLKKKVLVEQSGSVATAIMGRY